MESMERTSRKECQERDWKECKERGIRKECKEGDRKEH
jgi:hypothetical protein